MQITFQLTFQHDSELNTSFPVACGGSTHICTCNGTDMGVSWEKYTGCRQARILFSIVKPCDVDCTSWFSYIALQSDVFFCPPIAKVANKNVVSIWIAINQHSGVSCVEIHIIMIIKLYPPRPPLVESKVANSSQVFREILKTSVSACLSFPPPTYPLPSSKASLMYLCLAALEDTIA